MFVPGSPLVALGVRQAGLPLPSVAHTLLACPLPLVTMPSELLLLAGRRAVGTVPLARLFALRLVRPDASPIKPVVVLVAVNLDPSTFPDVSALNPPWFLICPLATTNPLLIVKILPCSVSVG